MCPVRWRTRGKSNPVRCRRSNKRARVKVLLLADSKNHVRIGGNTLAPADKHGKTPQDREEPSPVHPEQPPPAPPERPAVEGVWNVHAASTYAVSYNLIERIGVGTFGEVWRAEAPGGVEVAVKVIFRPVTDDEVKRELESLDLIKCLRHPYLLRTHAYFIADDRLRIAMELADSCLSDRLRECQKAGQSGIPLDELLGYFLETAEALDYLHGERVLHRDVKPDNILLLKGHAKVADFGLARLLQQNRQSVSASGAGTPPYMAPEVWHSRVNPASDQYSLALSYIELRLGRRLKERCNMMDWMFFHLQEAPDLSALGREEKRISLRALAKEPAKRYPTCVAFVEELAGAACDNTPASPIPDVSLQDPVGKLLYSTLRPGPDR